MLYFHPTISLKDERADKKRNLEIGPSERQRPIFGTNNQILEIWLCERVLQVII